MSCSSEESRRIDCLSSLHAGSAVVVCRWLFKERPTEPSDLESVERERLTISEEIDESKAAVNDEALSGGCNPFAKEAK